MQVCHIKIFVEKLIIESYNDDFFCIFRNFTKTRDLLLSIFFKKLKKSYTYNKYKLDVNKDLFYNTCFYFGLLIIHHMKINPLIHGDERNFCKNVLILSNIFEPRIEEIILRNSNESFPLNLDVKNTNFYVYDDLYSRIDDKFGFGKNN